MGQINFTIQDIISSLFAFLLFPLIFVIPGYVIGWFLDLFDFRNRLAATRFVIALVLSISLSPIITFLTWNLFSVKTTFVVLALFVALFILILIKSKRFKLIPEISRLVYIAMAAAAGWSIMSILSLIDIQLDDRLYYNVVSYDYTTRVAIINAMSRTGVPPINPSYYPGHPVLLTYLYYFWYIPCSLIDLIGGSWINGRDAMIASVSWCGLGLMAAMALYLKLRNPGLGQLAWKTGLLAGGLLLVSGLDFIPALLLIVRTRLSNGSALLQGDIEHWNEQITAWVGAVYWVPHHIAALIACMTAIMLVHSARGKNPSRKFTLMTIAGFAIASAVGLSVYVTLVFVIFWCSWMTILFTQKERILTYAMAFAGIAALLLASPFLTSLVKGTSTSININFPIAAAVRIFQPIEPFILNYPPLITSVIYFMLLPISYMFELGFFFFAGLFWIKQNSQNSRTNNSFQTAEIILLSIVIVFGSFVRSTAIGSNDLGWRVWLFGQFILLVWSVDVILRLFPDLLLWKGKIKSPSEQKTWSSLRVLIILGLITTIVDISLLRIWPILVDSGVAGFPNGFSKDTDLGKRTFSARTAYEFINKSLPEGIHIQQNPSDALNRPIGLYANRPIAISGHTTFGISRQEYLSHAMPVENIFVFDSNWGEIDRSCINNYIDSIVVTDEDPLWRYLLVLDQERSPLYKDSYYAIFSCGIFTSP